MADAPEALPGNPFARDLLNRARDNRLSEETLATLALAFEVRTANMQRQADFVIGTQDITDVSEDAFVLWSGLQEEIGRRLIP